MSKFHLTNEEKETICLSSEADRTFTIFTHRPSWIRKLEQLQKENPDEVVFIKQYNHGAVEYEVPKSYIRLAKPPKREYSDEEKRLAAERLQAARAAKAQSA